MHIHKLMMRTSNTENLNEIAGVNQRQHPGCDIMLLFCKMVLLRETEQRV